MTPVGIRIAIVVAAGLAVYAAILASQPTWEELAISIPVTAVMR